MKNDAPAMLLSYVIGFIASLALTVAAYLSVVNHILTGTTVIFALIALALVQLLVQLFFFLHLGREGKPRWNLLVLLFMSLVLAILVFGSLWIMHNLSYNMMPAQRMDMYMLKEEGIHK